MNKLTITMPSDREIAMTRAFDAPRHLVYQAYTKPELLKRWMGVHNGLELVVCEIDLRVGGTYRYVWKAHGGMSMGMGGVYQDIVKEEKIVSTEKFDESWYPGDAVGTVTFTEAAGRTTVTTTVLYASKEARDGVLKSPMAEGMGAGFDTLEKLLALLHPM